MSHWYVHELFSEALFKKFVTKAEGCIHSLFSRIVEHKCNILQLLIIENAAMFY